VGLTSIIRAERPEDHNAIHALTAAAFAPAFGLERPQK
jgi:predicted N-acetyltransferase YhbS